jgi:hypothetical protein
MHRRLLHLAFGVLLLVGTPWAAVPRATGAFSPFVLHALPQRVAADFDEDGRPDVAFIHDDRDGFRVSVSLSGSPDTVTLEVNAVSVAAGDIDHDGDTDLVMVTSSNQVVIWLNDGRGHFREQESPSQALLPATGTVDASRDEPMALGPRASQVVGPSRRTETAVVVTQIRLPTVPLAVALNFLSLPSLRAPPLVALLN